MHSLSRTVLLGLTVLEALVSASPLNPRTPRTVPRYFQKYPSTPQNLSIATIQQELGPQLSNGSLIFGPNNTDWAEATERYNQLAPPDIQVVVIPALESDVSKIVKYSSDNSIEFLAYNKGHGLTESLGTFKGLEINLRELNTITIAEDGESALFQGGTTNDEVMFYLWDEGYVVPTGASTCVGLLGPGLGGGHGRYEGLYGLVLDNFLHLNVVLADGSEVAVSETENSDLFWAMKGAGHNFGIVTSAQLKIYPRKIDTWHIHSYYWTGDKLEEVFEAVNTFHKSANGTTPPLMGVEAGTVSMNSSVSETEATLYWTFNYAGPADEAEALLAPFNAIEAVADAQADVAYPDISAYQKVDAANGGCYSATYGLSAIMMREYNVTAQREVYNRFNEWAVQYPALAKTARVYYEGYSTQAVQEVAADSSAYPHRDETHLIFFATLVPEDDLLEPANTWAKEMWDLWLEGEPWRNGNPAHYVNYATGKPFETLESIYGYEPWRLERLRDLKTKYDPNNKFRYYVPIVSS